MTKETGVFELTLLNAEVRHQRIDDVLIMGLNRGIPAEIMTRLEDLWSTTKMIADELVAVGKIIVLTIFDFLKANPKLTIGLALGAALATLVAGIPFLGALLAPVFTVVSMVYGAAVGASIDDGEVTTGPFVAVTNLAKKFFDLLKQIFLSVEDYLLASEVR